MIDIQELKRIIIKKHVLKGRLQCRVKGLQNYKFESEADKYVDLMKRRQNCNNLSLPPIALGCVLNSNKKRDVLNLLKKLFGEDWTENEDLTWYKIILLEDGVEDPRLMEVEDSNDCDCMEFDSGLHV